MTEREAATILLVEDERIIALNQKEILENYGYTVLVASNAEEAIEIGSDRWDVDLILMDVDLGYGMDGPEVTRRILERRNLPVVFLSAHAEREYVDLVREITNYGYVLKNSGEFVLIQAIRMAFELFRTKQALRESERRFQVSVEHGQITFAHTDEELRYTWVSNPHSFFRVDDLIGMRDTEITDNAGTRTLLQVKQSVLRTGIPVRRDISFPVPDGQHTYDVLVEPLRNEHGETVGVTSCAVDVTDRTALEHQYRLLADHSSDVVAVYDGNLSPTYISPSAEFVLGYPPEKFLGRDAFEIVLPKDRDMLLREIESDIFGRKSHGVYEYRIVAGWGEDRWVETKSAYVYDHRGKLESAVTNIRDITERKRIEERLGTRYTTGKPAAKPKRKKPQAPS